MKLFFILTCLFVIIICYNGFSQKYETSVVKYKFIDSERGNRRVQVDIYYPYDSAGTHSTGYSACGERFPVICFGHGYLISGNWYSYITEILVPEGFILIFPGNETGLFPSHRALAGDLSFAVNEIKKLDLDSSSPLFGRIDTLSCIMGHSMGGGSAVLAAGSSRGIRALVALAPYDTRPSAVKAATLVKVPTLIIAGGNDCITPPEKHQLPIYNSAGSYEKTYILIKGGTHCQMGVSHPKCSMGERISGCRDVSICMEQQLSILKRYLIPWLNYYLKRDTEAGSTFDSIIRSDTEIEFLRSCPLGELKN